MIQYYYTKKEWGVVMEKEELKILEELRRILNSKNEAIVILTTLIISKKPGNTGFSRDIRTEFTTDLLLSD